MRDISHIIEKENTKLVNNHQKVSIDRILHNSWKNEITFEASPTATVRHYEIDPMREWEKKLGKNSPEMIDL